MNFNMSLMLARLSKGSDNEKKKIDKLNFVKTENIVLWKVLMELKDNLHERKYLDTEYLIKGCDPKDIQRNHVTQ